MASTKPHHAVDDHTNREYLAPQIRSVNNRFHSAAKLPWSYDYPLANHIATIVRCPCFRAYTFLSYLRKIFPPRGLKYSLFLYLGGTDTTRYTMMWILQYMAMYPDVQAKMQQEIDNVMGKWPNLNLCVVVCIK